MPLPFRYSITSPTVASSVSSSAGISILYSSSRAITSSKRSIVTNEIFSEAADYQGETELYQEYLGQINQKIAEIADQVVEVVYGIPVYHKNKLLSGEG